MNGSSTFVLKMSRDQADLAPAMNENGNGILNGECCYCDGTFKRAKDFVTMCAYVYVGLLRRIVKLTTMEAESRKRISRKLGICSTRFLRKKITVKDLHISAGVVTKENDKSEARK